MSEKTIQTLDILHKKGAKFAGCLHEKDLKIWEASCCFPCFMFTLHIKLGLYGVNHIKTIETGTFIVNSYVICHEDIQ